MKVTISSVLLTIIPTIVAAQGSGPPAPPPTVVAAVRNVGSDQSGGGLVVRVNGRCIVVTALHVVDGAAEIAIKTSRNQAWSGDIEGRADAGDVATIVSPDAKERCSDMPAADAMALAAQGSEGQLLVTSRDGGMVSLPMSVVRNAGGILRITPKVPGMAIAQGWSGSPLVMSGVPVAILTGLSKDDADQGIAIRLDQAARLMGGDKLPIVEVTVVVPSAPLLEALGDSIARADAASLGRFKAAAGTGSKLGAADVIAAVRQPSDTAFVANKLFESIAVDPPRVAALETLLALGLPPDLLVPVRENINGKLDSYDKSLFWHAIDAGSVDAAVLLLKHGASPHGFRTPARSSPTNRMILPTAYVFEQISDPAKRRRLYAAMIEAGLVVPTAPRRYVLSKTGKHCTVQERPCPGVYQGDWRTGYEAWSGSDEDDRTMFREVVEAGNPARSFNGGVSCVARQVRRPEVPSGWADTISAIPSYFTYQEVNGYVGSPDFSVDGFIGVFADRAWFIIRRWGNLGLIEHGDTFHLLSVSRDLSRIETFEDEQACSGRSCLVPTRYEISRDAGTLILRDGRYTWKGSRECRPATLWMWK